MEFRSLLVDQPKIEKSKMLDVDSLFAPDGLSVDESGTTATSTVFFDSPATTGRASRFRNLFTQDAPAQRPVPPDSENRPGVERTQSNPLFGVAPKSGVTSEDREGFRRIMAMLGSGPNKPGVPNVVPSHAISLSLVRREVSTTTARTFPRTRWSNAK